MSASVALGPLAPDVWEPEVTVAITDRVALHGGGNLSLVRADKWAMGFGGVTVKPWMRESYHFRGGLDLELGGGLGVGGRCEDDAVCDDRKWNKRIASGGYVGSGIVIGHPRFAPFIRGRVQTSQADGIPPTLWWMTALGFEVGVLGVRRQDLPKLHLFVSGGLGGYTNRHQRKSLLLFSWGARMKFDLRARRFGRG